MRLESFPAPDAEQLTTFETDELTALCPFEFGGPDFYTVTLRYVADETVIESKSLKQYFGEFRDVEISAEELAATIHADIAATIEPERLYLCLEQQRRGGIEETVEMGDDELR
jgi:7-cyano-7-deazaguanine reductase